MDKKNAQLLFYDFFSRSKNHRFKNVFKNKIFLLISLIFLFSCICSFIYIIGLNGYEKSIFVSPLQNAGDKSLTKVEAFEENIDKENNTEVAGNVNNVNRDVIGFLPSWTTAQNTEVDLKILTQIIYFGLGVNDNGEIIQYNKEGNPTLEWQYFTSDYFINMRDEAKKNNVKVLVAFKMFDNESIDRLISNSVSTDFFIRNAIDIVKKYDLDGINVDFEYFTDSDFPTSRYLNKFLEKLSIALKEDNPENTLSVDVNATVILSDKAYDMVKIGEMVDQVVVMAYDYKNISSGMTGPTSPLYGEINEHSIDESVSSLVGRVNLDKVVLAIPFYGYEWETLNTKHKSTAVVNSGALATYKRVRELLGVRWDVKKYWDSKSKSPWVVYEQSGAIKQIYYEDSRSIGEKMKYIKDKGLRGIAVWAIGYEGKYNDLWNTIANSNFISRFK